MCSMNFKPLKAGSQGSFGSKTRGILNILDFLHAHFVWDEIVLIKSDRAGSDSLPSGSSIGLDGSPISHGLLEPAFLPACASWIPATAPLDFRVRVTRTSGSTWESDPIPISYGVMRPYGSTAVLQWGSALQHVHPGKRLPVVGKAIGVTIHTHRWNTDSVAKSDPLSCVRITFIPSTHHAEKRLRVYLWKISS